MTQPGIIRKVREGAAGVRAEDASTQRLFGLVELDSAGTVLYTRLEPNGTPQADGESDYTGQNFYTEVASFNNVVEFRNMLDDFRRGSQPAYSTDFTCEYEDGPLPVRVLFARIRDRAKSDATKSVLVHIRRAR